MRQLKGGRKKVFMKNLYETIERNSYVQYFSREEVNKNTFNSFSSASVSNKDRSMPSEEKIFNVDYFTYDGNQNN